MSYVTDKRERLIGSARDLFHQQGFQQTSLAQIAQKANVPLGNVYYYFKTKEIIGTVVLDGYFQWFSDLTEQWEQETNPKQRLHKMLDMVNSMADTTAKYGCPIGTLIQELSNTEMALTDKVDMFLQKQINWVQNQFRLLDIADATDFGIKFIATLQGTFIIAQSLHDPNVITRQIQFIREWLDSGLTECN